MTSGPAASCPFIVDGTGQIEICYFTMFQLKAKVTCSVLLIEAWWFRWKALRAVEAHKAQVHQGQCSATCASEEAQE